MTLESIEKLRGWFRIGMQGFSIVNSGGRCATNDVSQFINEIADEIEREIDERYMELPLDADGVPIRVGDVMLDYQTPRNVIAVASDSFVMDGFKNGSFYRPGLACNHSHVKPRTLEDVLCDLEGMRGNYADYEDVVYRAAEYAAEIRDLLGVVE